MKRYNIIETENGFILKTEWDCEDGVVEAITRVFEMGEGEILDALDKAFKEIRSDFDD